MWDLDLKDCAFAAASHGGEIINGINRVRLDTEHDYFNSGVMLMDLNKARGLVRREEVFQCVREHGDELLLPDQDIFNHLYGTQTLRVEDALWNYDARYFSDYLIRSDGYYNMDWVMKNTAVLHFCGKRKPWKQSYSKRFAALYKNYMQIASRYEASIGNFKQD